MGKLKEQLIKDNEKKERDKPLWTPSMSDFSYVKKKQNKKCRK